LWVEYRGGCTVTFRLDAFIKGEYLIALGVLMAFVMMCEKFVRYSIPRPWNDAPWISLKPLSLPLAVYFPDSAPVLVSIFNRTSVAKSFDTHEHSGRICQSRLEGELQRYANKMNIWMFCPPSIPGTSIHGLSWLCSCYGFYAVFKNE